MFKTEKLICIKKNSKTIMNVVREHYLRNDIPCKSKRCNSCEKTTGINLLPADTTHYVIPACEVQHSCGRRMYKQLQDLVKDPTKESVIFNNEFHKSCYLQRKHGDAVDEWRFRNIYKACLWYQQHFVEEVPIVIISDDKKVQETYGNQTTGIFVLSMEEYINGFWPNLSEAHDLLESLNALTVLEKNIGSAICKDFQEYYPSPVLQAGIKSGRFFSSYLKVNKHNPIHEAFIQVSDSSSSLSSTYSDIIIPGTALRNRAIDGDLVVVELLPKDKWQSKCSSLAEKTDAMMTGRVVGILQRNLRDFVVSIPEKQELSSKRILTIPWDPRIPKIRISTRQATRLKNDRFIVRIDSWEVDSLYPNGHFVKSLGAIGNIETEISTILVEHGLSATTFSDGIVKEMPCNTKDQPWKMEALELEKRKDLRNSHLIFSIDPIGCEDVDDTLSVRELPDGMIELGVHIADVTHFVKPNSLTDIEASSKTTTIYLADRRYDMLPEVLSAQLCSLLSGVDRYAVSVIWTLDKSFEVVDVWYGRTIIRSRYKLFYEAAQSIAEGEMKLEEALESVPELKCVNEKQQQQTFDELKHAIKCLMNIARHLKAKRSKNGAVDLESSEVQIHVSKEKEVKDLAAKKPLEVHETIAECMIFANHWVAKKIKDSYKNSALLRSHPAPKQEFFSSLRDCAKAKGFAVNTSSNQSLATSLDQCSDVDPNFNKILRMLATQAMMVAAYFSTGSIDKDQFTHYGLALESYTHFTSPIRRYADIIVHRLLLASVGDPSSEPSKLLGNKDLQELCDHINVKHREADHAQKDSVRLFQAMYFKQHNDDETCVVDAMAYNLRANGVLLFIPKYGIKGALFLKNKSGMVACPCGKNDIKFVKGSLKKYADKMTVSYESQSYDIKLFSYLKVRISVTTSRTHPETLRFDLVSFKTNVKLEKNQVTRKNLIQDVKETETQRTELIEHEEDVTLSNLKKRYGQTHKSVSLYELFQGFKKSAIMEKKIKRSEKH